MSAAGIEILFCQCAGRSVLPDGVKRAVLDHVRKDSNAWIVDDLCGLVASGDAHLRARIQAASRVVVVACHPRAVKWLLHAAGCPVSDDRLQVLDMRTLTTEAVVQSLSLVTTGAGLAESGGSSAASISGAGTAWFPVIDYDRCHQCRQCLSFCLFGVYELSPEGRVTVAQPNACKNNCPACARICPEVAILFPKLPDAESPLNGDRICDEDLVKSHARAQARIMLGDDVYTALAERRKGARRRRLLRPDVVQAEQERAAHLKDGSAHHSST